MMALLFGGYLGERCDKVRGSNLHVELHYLRPQGKMRGCYPREQLLQESWHQSCALPLSVSSKCLRYRFHLCQTRSVTVILAWLRWPEPVTSDALSKMSIIKKSTRDVPKPLPGRRREEGRVNTNDKVTTKTSIAALLCMSVLAVRAMAVFVLCLCCTDTDDSNLPRQSFQCSEAGIMCFSPPHMCVCLFVFCFEPTGSHLQKIIYSQSWSESLQFSSKSHTWLERTEEEVYRCSLHARHARYQNKSHRVLFLPAVIVRCAFCWLIN